MSQLIDELLKPSKTFGVVLAPSLVVSPDEFYGGFGEALRSLGYTKGQRVYMILRRPALNLKLIESPAAGLKAHILPRRSGGSFLFHLVCQGKPHKLAIPVIDFIWNLLPRDLKESHSRAELEAGVFAIRNTSDYVSLMNAIGPILGVELNIDDNGQRAMFTFHQPNAKPMTLPVTLDRLLGVTNQSLGIIGDVLYIGQTDNDEQHRLERHEKLQRALAECRSDEQILVLIGRFKPTCVQISSIGPRAIEMSEGSVKEITASDQLNLIEMTLINYFKPPMNETYKDGDELKGSIVSRSLVAAGFDAVEVHFDPDSPLMFAGTQTAGYQEEHHIRYAR